MLTLDLKYFINACLFFRDFLELGYILNDSLKLGLHSIMLLTAVFAFNQLRKLDINRHHMSLLDDVLLFICLPAFFLETVLSMIATVNIVNIIKSIDVIVMVRSLLNFVFSLLLLLDHDWFSGRKKSNGELFRFISLWVLLLVNCW